MFKVELFANKAKMMHCFSESLLQKTPDLVTFTEEILNEKHDFLCSDIFY